MDLLDKTLEYAKSMPEGCDFIFTVGSEENATIVRERCKDLPYNVDVRVIQNRGRDVSALLVGAGKDCLQYDYVCFAHDKKVTQLSPYSIGDGFAYKCFENVLGRTKSRCRFLTRSARFMVLSAFCQMRSTSKSV